MTKKEFYDEFEKIIEAPHGSVSGTDSLSDLAGWDSLASLSLIAVVDEKLSVNLAGRDIQACQTVEDLVRLCGDKVL